MSVPPVEVWPVHLTAQHGDLVAQREDLDLLGAVTAPEHDEELEDAAEDEVQQGPDHEQRGCPLREDAQAMKSEVNSIESWVSAPYTRGTPGHPARQPGHCHTPTLKSMLSNTVQRRQAPAISPDERSGLASSPLMERRTGDALRPQEAAPDSHITMTEPLFGEWRCSSTRAHARLARSTLQLSLRKASSLRLGAGVRARCGNRTRRSDSCGSLESCHCVRLRPPGGRLLPQRSDRRNPDKWGSIGRLLPQRAYRGRSVGTHGAHAPGCGGRAPEPAPDRRARQGSRLGGRQRRDQLGRHARRRLLRVALRDRDHRGRASHLRVRAGAGRAVAGRAAKAGRLRHRHAAGHQPRLDVVHVLPAEAPSGRPDSGKPAARPGAAARPLLRDLQPRLHGCLRAVTTRLRTADAPPARPAALARRPGPAGWFAAVVQTSRPRQWPKNLLVFAAPLAGASLGRDDGLGYALVAAAAFIAASDRKSVV